MADNKGIDYDQLKGQLENIWAKTLVTLDKGKNEIIRLSKIGKVKLDIQMMIRDKNVIFQKMGEETYKGIIANNIKIETLKKHVSKVEVINQKISAAKLLLDELSRSSESKKKEKK